MQKSLNRFEKWEAFASHFHLAVNNSYILQIFQLLLPVDMVGTVMPVEGVDSDLLGGSNTVVGGKKAFSGADVIL